MRAVVAIVLLLLVLGFVGWVQFSSPNGDPTIRVDTEKIKQDTSEIIEKTKETVDGAAEKIHASIDEELIKPATE